MTTEIEVANPLAITYSGKKQKILEMLGNGYTQELVATSLGVSPSLVSQYLSDEEFASAVIARRYERLNKHTARDDRLDGMEDELIKKLEDMLGMVYKPMEVARLLQLVNGLKRRGAGSDPTAATIINNQVVNLQLPPAIVQHFTADINNQVVEVIESTQPAEQQRHSLITMSAGNLQQLAKARRISYEQASSEQTSPPAALGNSGSTP